ncbi:GNAT family N-acetyltransferase [Anabaena azotica]|uniref:GNAT family N-acetyltransferase n=1 Tax=Anabaena azotica FACHB-119 TaxID=947527 RepID=A0ABR8D0L8_9NOST|nr:GNAT family N-acetyltransferase [Anabaena azotica]MBD2499946.1 GNAT family N-acetyltransferase [Anabaena azotica FACHB-119]
MRTQIRKYRRENFDSVLRIVEEENLKSHSFLSDEELRKSIDDLRKELCEHTQQEYSIKIWIICEGDNIVGFTSVREYSNKTQIVYLYVSAAHQKKGYGKKLLNKVYSECKPPYSLAVLAENQNAYNFYVRLGFHIEEESMEANHKYLVMAI